MSRSQKTKSKGRPPVSRVSRAPVSPTDLLPPAPSANAVAPSTPPAEDARLQLWAAAGQMQAGDFESARELMRQALRSGANRQLAARLLVGSVYTSLGRASMLAEQPERGVRQLSTGLDLGVPGGSALWLDLLMAEAERCTRRGDDREAIQRWQDIACLLGARTPEHVYQRLSDAYARNREGFGGAPDENHLWGDCDKHDLLAFMHEQLQPRLYLEIGVDEGASLTRARGRAIGVDPRPKLALKHPLNEHTTVISLSSDAFFRERAAALLQPPPDLVFIDGMHLFEFALRDFMNVERHAHPATLVVIDDIYPCHPTQATRRRRSGAWTGDIWKLHRILRERRPDLTLIALNANTTGLLLIAGLDPDNRVLWDDYEAIVQRHRDERAPPPAVLERHGAIPSDHPLVLDLLKHLKQANAEALGRGEVRAWLAELAPRLQEAEQTYWGRARALSGHCNLRERLAPPPQNEHSCRKDGITAKAQLFIPQVGEPAYVEEASSVVELNAGYWQDVMLSLPYSEGLMSRSLRFDPVDQPGFVQIDRLCVSNDNDVTVLFSAEHPDELRALSVDGDARMLTDSPAFLIYSSGSDPRLYVPIFSPGRTPITETGNLTFQARLRFKSLSAD